jgi:hypothetical protein
VRRGNMYRADLVDFEYDILKYPAFS